MLTLHSAALIGLSLWHGEPVSTQKFCPPHIVWFWSCLAMATLKTRVAIDACIVVLCLSGVLIVPLLVISGQSRRAEPQRTTSPSPGPSPTTRPDAKRVVNADGEIYKLVFPSGYDGKLSYRLDKEKNELKRADESEFTNFSEQLNKAGARGFKVKSAIHHHGVPVAILKFDESRYEYAWFVTTGYSFFSIGEFQQKYAEFSKQGFQLVDHFLTEVFCEDNDLYLLPTPRCESNRLFLLEREEGAQSSRQHRLVISVPRWRTRQIGVELLRQINEGLGQFYPTHVLSKYEILLEQPTKNDELPSEKPDLRVVRDTSAWGQDNLPKNVNEMAKQGYRLALVGDGIAVMYKPVEPAPIVSYVWLDAKKKNFEQQLAQLQAQGAIYRMAYPYIEGIKSQLILEQASTDDGQKREYKVLKFDFQVVVDPNLKNRAEGRVHIDLTPGSKEVVNLLNSLAKEGFVVRDLFVSDKVSVLLERPR